MSDHHLSSFGFATFDVAGGLFSPRRQSVAAPARVSRPKAVAAPAVSAEEVAALRAELAALKAAPPTVPAAVQAELASLREELQAIKDAPAAARRRETLKNVVIADMEWRNQIR